MRPRPARSRSPRGPTTQPVVVKTLQGDVLDEANETYRVTLSNPINATITTAIGTGHIHGQRRDPRRSPSTT